MRLRGLNEFSFKKHLNKLYDLDIWKIEYIPMGEDCAAYTIYSGEAKYFVKVHRVASDAMVKLKDIKAIVGFLFDLHRKYGFENTPLPIASVKGKLITDFAGFPVVLYKYIEGGVLSLMSDRDYHEAGRLLALIHNIETKDYPKIRLQRMNLAWENKILGIVKEVGAGSYRSKEKLVLKSLLLKDFGFYKEALKLLKDNLTYLEKKKSRWVIVHSDLHPGNLMKDGNGLQIIDWDGLEFSMPEKDLMWFVDGGKMDKNFEEGYVETRKPKFKLDLKSLKHYKVRRIMSDIVFFSDIILHKRDSRKKEYLKKIGGFSNSLRLLIENA